MPRSHCCVGCPSDRARRCERRCHRNWWATHNPGALHEGVWFWVKQAQRPILALLLILVLMPELMPELVLVLVLVPVLMLEPELELVLVLVPVVELPTVPTPTRESVQTVLVLMHLLLLAHSLMLTRTKWSCNDMPREAVKLRLLVCLASHTHTPAHTHTGTHTHTHTHTDSHSATKTNIIVKRGRHLRRRRTARRSDHYVWPRHHHRHLPAR